MSGCIGRTDQSKNAWLVIDAAGTTTVVFVAGDAHESVLRQYLADVHGLEGDALEEAMQLRREAKGERGRLDGVRVVPLPALDKYAPGPVTHAQYMRTTRRAHSCPVCCQAMACTEESEARLKIWDDRTDAVRALRKLVRLRRHEQDGNVGAATAMRAAAWRDAEAAVRRLPPHDGVTLQVPAASAFPMQGLHSRVNQVVGSPGMTTEQGHRTMDQLLDCMTDLQTLLSYFMRCDHATLQQADAARSAVESLGRHLAALDAPV